jgi:hypothetical protein
MAVTHWPPLSQQPFGQELALHATHDPPEQICLAPQGLVSCAGSGASWSLQTDVPAEQSIKPLSQTFEGATGVHDKLAEQAVHAPPEQTMLTPQARPSAAGTPWSLQVVWPCAHTIFPALQGLLGGGQSAPAVQLAQAPSLQNALTPHGVPLLALPAGAQTATPELQSLVILWHEFGGVQSAPAAQPTHVP